ncbi:MAG TPA: glycosyltransferase family 2 protein [Rhodopila sp.]
MPHANRPSGAPRVIALTMVKNEQDIIEPMLRHNARLLDALIVLDNGSVDDTRMIALSLARELGNIVVTDSAGFGYTQGERMTRLLHAAQTSYFADFVLFLDADEFIGSASRTSFHRELAKIPPGGAGAVTWRNFVFTGGAAEVDPLSGLTQRLANEALPITKTVLRLDGRFQADLAVGRGSHLATHGGVPLAVLPLPELPLWHFAVRSQAQLTAKALVGWLACLAANPHAAKTPQSYHWRDMFRRIVHGPGFGVSDLRRLSLHYADPNLASGQSWPAEPAVVDDSPAIDRTRRYSTGEFIDPLILLARSWEQALRARDPLFTADEAVDAVIDIPPFRFLREKHRLMSVLDVGCGIGLGLELFSRLGVLDLAGVGTLPPESLVLRRGGYVRHDPAAGFTLGRQYDLVLCLNTPAGGSARDALTLMANVDRHARTMIAFSLDSPGLKTIAEWLARWRQMDWVPDLMETLALRCLSSSAALRRGLVILRRTSARVSDGQQADMHHHVVHDEAAQDRSSGKRAMPGGATPDGAACDDAGGRHATGEHPAADGTSGDDVTVHNAAHDYATAELLAIAERPYRMPAPVAGVHEEALLDAAQSSWLGYAVPA